ncbi:MAG: DUF418 domain-containing protein [Woeseiaceae bacterium]
MSNSDPDLLKQATVDGVAAPVTGMERISSLDILRGVAILGILVINIYAFTMPLAAYPNPLLMGGTDAVNMGVWFFTHIIFDQKFMSIFSMLFGAGIILMTGRAEEKGAKFGRIFYRRQLWLLLIGAIHGYLIWFGDILFLYAAIGMVAYLFRRKTPRTLIIVACCLLPVAALLFSAISSQTQQMKMIAEEASAMVEAGEEISAQQQAIMDQWEIQRAFAEADEESLQKDVDTHLGSYSDILSARIPLVIMLQIFTIFVMGLFRVLALMLLGMALMKLGVLAAEKSAGFYRKMFLICYGIGLPLTMFSAYDLNAHGFDQYYVMEKGQYANYFGSVIIGLGHIGLVMFLVKIQAAQKLMQRFAAVGRMALTNYLMHSVILTTIFYGYGLGLYGSITRIQQMGFVAAVIILQLFYSSWWLARYRFGPVEWLWRSLTYWNRQPMRRQESA